VGRPAALGRRMSTCGGKRAEERTQRLPVSTQSSRGNETRMRASLSSTYTESVAGQAINAPHRGVHPTPNQSQVRPSTLRTEGCT
jgi:hypothetical protein